MRFKTAIGGFLWIDILTVTSVLFVPDGILQPNLRKHVITFYNQASVETILASGEDERLMTILNKISSAKLAAMGIPYAPGGSDGL